MSAEWKTNGLCRCCHNSGNVRSLGATYTYEGSDEIYSELLRETFNIVMSESEENPSSYCICMACVMCLRDAVRFRRQVLECEARFLMGYFGESSSNTESKNEIKEENINDSTHSGNIEDDFGFNVREDLDHIVKYEEDESSAEEESGVPKIDSTKPKNSKVQFDPVEDDPEDQPLSVLAANKTTAEPDAELKYTRIIQKQKSPKKLKCEFCSKKFSYAGSLEVHMKVHKGEKMYSCLLCHSKYGLNKDLTKHISEVHQENGGYPCKFCEAVYDKPSKLRTHLNTHLQQSFKCNFCEKDFQRKKGLKEHLKVHSGERKYSCHICPKSFGHNQTLKTHILTHTGEKPFVCDVCGRSFPQRTHLKRHIFIIHTGVKPYSCNVCKKQFSSKSYLSTHERLHTGEKPFSCEVCKKNFTAYTTLKVHMRVHTGIKPYTCSFCSRTFAQMASFKLHERTHTGARPYCCEICRKRFSDNGYLKIHMRIHSNEKPFECQVCKRSFRETGQLKRHTRVHTGVKPYTCKICNKQIGNLSKHMKVHSDERPYVNCSTCLKTFPVANNLKLHSMRLHNGQISCEQCQNSFSQNSEAKKS